MRASTGWEHITDCRIASAFGVDMSSSSRHQVWVTFDGSVSRILFFALPPQGVWEPTWNTVKPRETLVTQLMSSSFLESQATKPTTLLVIWGRSDSRVRSRLNRPMVGTITASKLESQRTPERDDKPDRPDLRADNLTQPASSDGEGQSETRQQQDFRRFFHASHPPRGSR